MRRAGWQVGAGALKPNMQLESSHQPHLLSVLVLASYSGVAIMTPPAPALAALLLSGFALFACLGMLAVTLQREIDVEVGSGASAFLDVFTWHLAPGQVESLQEVEERLGDLEAEHDYLIEADSGLHKPSSHNQQVAFHTLKKKYH